MTRCKKNKDASINKDWERTPQNCELAQMRQKEKKLHLEKGKPK